MYSTRVEKRRNADFSVYAARYTATPPKVITPRNRLHHRRQSRVRVTSELKRPAIKLSTSKNTIKLKPGMAYKHDGVVTSVTAKLDLNIKDMTGTLEIWTRGTAKKAPSAKWTGTLGAS